MWWLVATSPVAASASYTPPGVLQQLVDEKRREVDRMRKLPEAREDGPWYLRLGYPSGTSSYALGRAIGWRRERPAVFIDVKRTSPTGEVGTVIPIQPGLVVEDVLMKAARLGIDGALVSSDLTSYGGSYRDVRAACTHAQGGALGGPDVFPVVCKDLIVDPLQISRAACEGARAVLLIAAACLPDLPALLDTCTLLGVEAMVEVHTPDEVTVAAESGAGILLVNERDRATGELVPGQCTSLAPFLPPDAVCLATGGISRISQVRKLRRAGYDGFVIGRGLCSDPRDAAALVEAIAAEEPLQRWGESISVPLNKDAAAKLDEIAPLKIEKGAEDAGASAAAADKPSAEDDTPEFLP